MVASASWCLATALGDDRMEPGPAGHLVDGGVLAMLRPSCMALLQLEEGGLEDRLVAATRRGGFHPCHDGGDGVGALPDAAEDLLAECACPWRRWRRASPREATMSGFTRPWCMTGTSPTLAGKARMHDRRSGRASGAAACSARRRRRRVRHRRRAAWRRRWQRRRPRAARRWRAAPREQRRTGALGGWRWPWVPQGMPDGAGSTSAGCRRPAAPEPMYLHKRPRSCATVKTEICRPVGWPSLSACCWNDVW